MKKVRFFIYTIIVMSIISGCTSQRKQETKFEKKDRAPESLGSVSEGLQELLDNNKKVEQIIDGTHKEEESKKEESPEGSQASSDGGQEKQGNGGEEQGSNQGGQGASKEGNKEKEDQKKKEENLKKTWQSIDKKIEEIHQQWNGYVGEGRKKGVSADNLEKFSNSLNLLTKAIENKNVADIYDYGSQSMSNLSPAFELYKDEVLGEINKIKNATYQSYLKFLEDKTTQASRILADGKEEISKLRLKLKDDEKKIKSLDKVGISLEEMEKSIKEDSLKLIRIKMDIVLKSLGDLEK